MKTTWKNVFEDFKNRHPNLSKYVVRWCPYDYGTIKLHLSDGEEAVYNITTHETKFLPRDQKSG